MIDNRMVRRGLPQRNDSCRTDSMGCDMLTKKLRTVDFAIIETALYLDAYPKCQKALDYYCQLIKERDVLAEAINHKCGPMTIRDNESCDTWTWTKGPWPWEAEAN